ncbi:hypothetical protein BDF22DRAFT_742098 [Syncephalis plumigaleata]|nr:hypothetical protein BDF22DRAFT_742098 [Syncephalis plumigaleata]
MTTNDERRGGDAFAHVVMQTMIAAKAKKAKESAVATLASEKEAEAEADTAGQCATGEPDASQLSFASASADAQQQQQQQQQQSRHLDVNDANDDDDIDEASKRVSTTSSSIALDKLRKAAQAVAAPQLMARADESRLKRVASGNEQTFELIASATAAPALWLKRDSKGHRMPTIIYELLELGITDSKPESELLETELSLPMANGNAPEHVDTSGRDAEAPTHPHRRGGDTIFRIELKYGPLKWVIYRKMMDFVKLHSHLTAKYLQGKLAVLPSFPGSMDYAWDKLRMLDHEKSAQVAAQRRKAFEDYLLQVMRQLSINVTYEMAEFLEISALSIAPDQGWKGKEGYLEVYHQGKGSASCLKRHWRKRWVVIRDSYIGISKAASDAIPCDVFLCDPNFTIQYEEDNSKNPLRNHVLIFSNHSRKLKIRGGDKRIMHEWLMSAQALRKQTRFVERYQHGSFAPIRKHVQASGMLTKVYIEDWWLSPELYLKRPPATHQQYRLDRLLLSKAEQGVKIYIVVYKEVALALTINSAYTKTALKSLHPNILVQRHPDHGTNGTFLWAHHEKMVIVDDEVAFVGGLDLCFGRYDTHAHRLTDFDPNFDMINDEYWPGQDYSNPRVKDFANVNAPHLQLIDRRYVPRMPWHDVSMRVTGQAARDVGRHFVERWNFIKLDKGMVKETIPFLMPSGEFVSTRDEHASKGTCQVQIVRSSAMWSSGIEHEYSIQKAYIDLISTAKHFIYIENQFFVTSTKDDPDFAIKNRIGQAIVDRVCRASQEGTPFRVIVVMPLMPAFEAEVDAKDANTLRMVMNYQYISIARGPDSIYAKLSAAGVQPDKYITFYGLRNYDLIHAAKPNIVPDYNPEQGDASDNSSHAEPHVRASTADRLTQSKVIPTISSDALSKIDKINAKHGGSTALGVGPMGGDHDAPNQIPTLKNESNQAVPTGGNAQPSLDQSFSQAVQLADAQIAEGKQYVTELTYIHTKLMIIDDTTVVCGSANINDRSMEGNRDSEICVIIEDHDKIDTRMGNHPWKAGRLAYTLRMQLMREHCGLLPHTDMRILRDFGTPSSMPESFNELARESNLDGGLGDKMDELAKALEDPASDEFIQFWQSTSTRNTESFRQVFRCVPDDTVKTMEEYKKFVPNPKEVLRGHIADPNMPVEQVEEILGQIRGHLVDFPNHFLEEENLGAAYFSAENLMPVELFI